METNDLVQPNKEWQGEAEEAAQNISEKMKSQAEGLRQKANQWQRKTVETMRRASETADVYVHESPWIIIGSVAAACLAIGFVLGRRR